GVDAIAGVFVVRGVVRDQPIANRCAKTVLRVDHLSPGAAGGDDARPRVGIFDLRFSTCDLRLIAIIAIGLLFGISCDRKDAGSSSRTTKLARSVFGAGTIRGTVKFIGTPPPRETIANVPCHPGAPQLQDETVVVNADGTLANVLVYLANAPASDGSDRQAALLDQKDCRYVPHVVGVQAGQTLKIRSSDGQGTMHNVHLIPQKNPAANF